MNPYEQWSLIVQFAGIIIVVIASLAAVWQLRLLAQQNRQTQLATIQDHERRRKQATLEFYASTYDRQVELDKIMPTAFEPQAVASLTEKVIQGDMETYKIVTAYLGLYEHIAAGVRADVFDIDVLNQAAGARLVAIAQNYGPYIQQLRRLRGIPDIFIELEWLGQELTRLRRRLGQMPALDPQIHDVNPDPHQVTSADPRGHKPTADPSRSTEPE